MPHVFYPDLQTYKDPSTPASQSGWAERAQRVLIGPTDVISNLPVVIEYDHHQLHEGEMFRWSVLATAGLASGSSKHIRFVVPNIPIPSGTSAVMLCPHFRFEGQTDAYGLFYLREGTTWNANGTQRTPIAQERNGVYTPKLEIWEDPTVNVAGTLLYQDIIGASAGASRTGGTIGNTFEFVLKNNTEYHVELLSQTNGLKYVLRFLWYEDLGV